MVVRLMKQGIHMSVTILDEMVKSPGLFVGLNFSQVSLDARQRGKGQILEILCCAELMRFVEILSKPDYYPGFQERQNASAYYRFSIVFCTWICGCGLCRFVQVDLQ